jgi:nitroreductase
MGAFNRNSRLHWAESIVRRHLGLDAQDTVVCGLALGYADVHAPVNQTRTTRCELEEFFRVVG